LGSGYNQLFVNGTMTLANATLAASINFPGLALNQTFDIIRSPNQIQGTFTGIADGGAVFLGGVKFLVNYNVVDSSTNTFNVRLTHVALSTTTKLSPASPSSGVPNTLYTITATITPENSGGAPQGNVVFTVTGPNSYSNTSPNEAVSLQNGSYIA